MTRRKLTVADFPPEFMSAWELAAKKELLLSFDTAGLARNWIQRMYIFRKRLVEEAPQIAAPFYLVDLRIHDSSGNVVVGRNTNVPGRAIVKVYSPEWKTQIKEQIKKSEGEVTEAFTAPAGGRVEELPVLPIPVESGDNAVDALAETLSDLGYGVNPK